MIQEKLLKESSSPEAPQPAENLQTEIRRPARLRGILTAILSGPAGIVRLVKEGQTSKASFSCWIASLIAGGLAVAWFLTMMPCMMLGLVPVVLTQGRAQGILMNLVAGALTLPGLVAAALIPLSNLLGSGLGLIGFVSNAGHRALGALGFFLNLLMLVAFLALAIMTIAFAG
jgi:hypothetical protein